MIWLGEITLFSNIYVPKEYKICDGSSVLIADYPLLFDLIGTTYGGDGVTHFNLPDYRGRVPVGVGELGLGGKVGFERVILNIQDIPPHKHIAKASTVVGNAAATPVNRYYANTAQPAYKVNSATIRKLNTGSVAPSGAGTGHNNIQPSIILLYAIAVLGQYPDFEVMS